MATPNEKIATSLEVLRKLQAGGRRVFSSKELSRVHRDRLVKHGYLRRVTDGWLIRASPSSQPGESTPWLSAFWEFCGRYCESRFDTNWHLSAEQSLLLQVGTTVIPTQVIIYSPKAQNNKIELLHDTSVYDIRETQPPPAEDLTVLDNLRVFSLESALTRVPDAFFAAKPLEAQIALNSVPDASGILRILLRGGHSVVAGRLAGAFRRIGRVNLADEIVAAMRAAEHHVPESDPFVAAVAAPWVGRRVGAGEAPIVGRLYGFWALTRETVIAAFPMALGLPHDRDAYLHQVDEIYVTDAYHSLSIEGYQVTVELIERVRTGAWRPETNEEEQRSRSAMAARGYWQAFTAVKRGVAAVLEGSPAAELARDAHPEWYRELFQPSVAAGIVAPAALAGYRHDFVYLKTSRYVPPRREAVRDAMPTLFDLMAAEPEACVRAVLGHWLIGYIHPYMDGNGRISRFLMNVMLASGGYPWTVIRLEDRARYLHALDRASLEQDIGPFAQLIAERVQGGPPAKA